MYMKQSALLLVKLVTKNVDTLEIENYISFFFIVPHILYVAGGVLE